jgi:hypothetical protein
LIPSESQVLDALQLILVGVFLRGLSIKKSWCKPSNTIISDLIEENRWK